MIFRSQLVQNRQHLIIHARLTGYVPLIGKITHHIQDCDDGFDPIATTGRYVDESNDLMRYVLSQSFGICIEPDVMQCVAVLIERLDSNGYLNEDLATLSRIAKKILQLWSELSRNSKRLILSVLEQEACRSVCGCKSKGERETIDWQLLS